MDLSARANPFGDHTVNDRISLCVANLLAKLERVVVGGLTYFLTFVPEVKNNKIPKFHLSWRYGIKKGSLMSDMSRWFRDVFLSEKYGSCLQV